MRRPARLASSSVMGSDAEEVLPYALDVQPALLERDARAGRSTASMMRRLAWWAMTWVTSPGGEPVARRAPRAPPRAARGPRTCRPRGRSSRPCCSFCSSTSVDCGCCEPPPGMVRMSASVAVGVEVGATRMPRSRVLRRARAPSRPAASPKSTQVLRSVQSISAAEQLRADHQRPLAPARSRMYWSAMDMPVERARARRRDVEGEGLLRAQLGLHEHRAGRHRHVRRRWCRRR